MLLKSDDTQHYRLYGILHTQADLRMLSICHRVRLARRRQRGAIDAENMLIRANSIHKLESEQEMVGLGRIEAEDTWMVPVGEDCVVYAE